MVRHYKKKEKTMKWSEEDMEKAIDYARTHKNITAAAKQFKIPVSTLRDHIRGKSCKGKKPGHPTVLTMQQEQEIVDTCTVFAEWGFGLGRREIESIIQNYLKSTKQPHPFHNSVPGEGWWSGFMRRHNGLCKRKPQHLQMVRAKATTKPVIDHWFNNCLKQSLEDLDLFNKPEQIFNVNESGFPLGWTPKTILAKRGQKSPQALLAGSGRENITVQMCVSATGKLLPPYIVYKGERLMSDCTYGGPLATRFAVSHNGWMTEETFIDWMRSLFIPSLPDERPILLILDGHSSHVSYEIRVLAIENQIHLLKLPPHTTHALQPLDVGVLNHLKVIWQKIVGDFTRRERRIITKRDFPSLLDGVWKQYKPQWAKGGFCKCGIVPFKPESVPDSLFSYSDPFSTSQVSDKSPTASDENSLVAVLQSETENDEITSGVQIVQIVPSTTNLSTPTPPSLQSPLPISTHLSSPPTPPSLQSLQSSPPPASTAIPSTLSSSTTQSSRPPSLPMSTPILSPTTQSSPPPPASTSITSSSNSLRDFFADLLKSKTPTRNSKTQVRKRLTGLGESLTSNEAIERVRMAQEEKEQKEREKIERAQERKRKKEEKEKEKQEKQKNKQKVTSKPNKKKPRDQINRPPHPALAILKRVLPVVHRTMRTMNSGFNVSSAMHGVIWIVLDIQDGLKKI